MPKRGRITKADREISAPTPETAAKLPTDWLRYLYGAGHLTDEQFAAGLEIREIIDAIRALYLRSPSYDDAKALSAGARHHLDGLVPAIRERYLERYIPWARQVPHEWTDEVIAVCVDCRPTSLANRSWQWLVRGLNAYAAQAKQSS